MSDIAISIENLGKRYRIGLKEERAETMGEALGQWLRAPGENFRRLRRLSRVYDPTDESEDLIWAIRDVSLKLRRGEILGVIGHNGAGKTTLLSILSRITEPTTGRIVLEGRVSSLLEVGTGFHLELTGRENIYLNGTILGMTKSEVDRKLEEIIDFSGISKFVDTPVKRYSAGMKVRLAFSVAAHLEPEILLVDEVLAVGDAKFQRKCLGKMEGVANGGRTVVLVSHDMGAIASLATRAILLEEGYLVRDGNPSEVIERYLAEQVASGNGAWPGVWIDSECVHRRKRSDFSFTEIELENPNNPTLGPRTGEPLRLRLMYESDLSIGAPAFTVRIKDTYGHEILRLSTMPISGYAIDALHSRGCVELLIESVPLVSGDYIMDVYLVHDRVEVILKLDNVLTFHVQPKPVYGGEVVMDRSRGLIVTQHRWHHEARTVGTELGGDGD